MNGRKIIVMTPRHQLLQMPFLTKVLCSSLILNELKVDLIVNLDLNIYEMK